MNFELQYTEEQEEFRKEVKTFLETAISKDLKHPVDPKDLTYDQYMIRRAVGKALGEKGWLWPMAPTEYGGGGLSIDHAIIIEEEVGKYGLPIPPYYDSGGRLGGPSILVWGTEEQKQEFLPPIFKGEVRTWQLLSEPSAGSDLAGVQTTAILDGDDYVINGQKIWVGSNHGAEQSWMICLTDPEGKRHENLSWFIVPMDLPGITIVPMDLLTTGGEGGAGTGEKNTIFFDNVRIPATNLIGGLNNGWKVATTHLELEHGGGGQIRKNDLVDRIINYCKNSESLGEPLIKNQDIQDNIVDIYIESEITRLFNLRNYWLAHANKQRTYEGPQSSFYRKTSALRIAEKILDILGPYAITNDEKWGLYDGAIELQHRGAIVGLHPGGTTDIQRVIMSRRIGIGREIKEQAGTLS